MERNHFHDDVPERCFFPSIQYAVNQVRADRGELGQHVVATDVELPPDPTPNPNPDPEAQQNKPTIPSSQPPKTLQKPKSKKKSPKGHK